MPLSREFLKSGYDLPVGDIRTKKVALLATKLIPSKFILESMLEQIMTKSWSLQNVTAIKARLLKAGVTKNRDKIVEHLSPNDISLASQLLFAYSMGPTEAAMLKGDLTSLRVFKVGGIFFTRGRVGRSLEQLLGITRLPVLMSSTRLAKLLMWDCHSEDHRRSHSDALARSRERAWIVKGTSLAKLVTKNCPKCKLADRHVAKQLMPDLPLHQTIPCPPFTNISLDFLGPYKVKGLGNQRARIKVYGLVIVFQNVRAVKLLAVPRYDTYSFLLDFSRFASDHGAPALEVPSWSELAGLFMILGILRTGTGK